MRGGLRNRLFRSILVCLPAGFLCGCVTAERERESVRRVEHSQAPELGGLAGRARQIGNEVYPRILELLPDRPAKLHHQFDIIFTPTLVSNVAQTVGTKIYLNASWYRSNPDTLEVDLPHEMAHVAQQHTDVARWYWTEGLADYVCYKLGRTNGITGPPTSSGPALGHYTSGYWVTGAFLFFLDRTYGAGVVQRLNLQLRRGTYSDRMFADMTGKSLELLWKEFQMSSADPLAPK